MSGVSLGLIIIIIVLGILSIILTIYYYFKKDKILINIDKSIGPSSSTIINNTQSKTEVSKVPNVQSSEDQINLLKNKAKDWIVPYNELKIGPMLGKGSQGEVYKAEWRGSIIAVKKVDIRNVGPDIVEEFCAEADIMRRLRHPCLCMFMGICIEHPNLSILTECVARGSLFDLLHDECIPISWNLILRMATDIAEGMNYLHCYQPNIVHRDLKSLNLLVDENWRIKIIDFGMTRFEDSNASMTQCGSPLWMAPEMIMSEPYNEKIDVYSYGICLWELYTRRIPYRSLDITPQVLVARVVQENLRPTIPKHSPPELTNLMQSCWHADPKQRPSFQQILDSLHDMKTRGVIPIVGNAKTAAKPVRSMSVTSSTSAANVPGFITSPSGSDSSPFKIDSWQINFSEILGPVDNKTWRGKPVSVVQWPSKAANQIKVVLESLKDPNIAKRVSVSNPLGLHGVQLFEKLSSVRHPSMLLFMGSYFNDQEIGLVYEKLPNSTTLYQQLSTKIFNPEWDIQIQMLLDIAIGISYLHGSQPPAFHHYLSSKTILLSQKNAAKIQDYSYDDLRSFLGNNYVVPSPSVTPPEWNAIQQGHSYTPGPEADETSGGQRPSIPKTLAQNFIELIESCWSDDPYRRPRITSVITRLESIKSEGPPRNELTIENANRYQKKQLTIAYQSKDPITIMKAWGKSKGRAGAFVILGSQDDVYCCDEEIFNLTYQPVSNRPHTYRKIGTILAKQMPQAFSVKTITGTIEHGAEGDYLVQNDQAEQWPIEQEQFDMLYEEVLPVI